MTLLISAITFAIIVLAISMTPVLISRKTKLVEARRNEKGEKTIDYSHSIFWFIYVGGALFSIIGALVYLFSEDAIGGSILFVMGLIFILPMAIIQFADTSINWSHEYIRGAKSGVRLKKNLILWDDVEWVKFHSNNTIQVKDTFGKSVYWTVYHNDWKAIIKDLRRIRPDIDLSDFEQS